MINNYDYIIETINNIIKKLYSLVEEYLQNIFNAPSTINRVLRYYGIGFNPSEPNKRYIFFKGMVVKELELILPKYDFLTKGQLLRLNEV